jgi:hypothetical protein
VEQREDEEGMETTILKKKIQHRIPWEMMKMDTPFLTPTKQRYVLCHKKMGSIKLQEKKR